MLKFLKNARSAERLKNTIYVIGNQSADMDSCCSAIAGAYLYSCSINAQQDVVPLINIPRSDLRLRPDIKWVLNHLNIDESLLHFTDETPLTSESLLFLVDHNSPTVPGKVFGIIDHHEPEGVIASSHQGPCIMEKAGSCVSLIVDYFRSNVPDASVWDDQALTSLCSAPIMLDTKNLEFKVEDSDKRTFKFLSEHNAFGSQPQQFYAQLKDRKKDIDGFTAKDLLRKDFKRWGDLGISSLPLLFHKVLKKYPDFPDQLREFMKEEKLHVAVALTSGNIKDQYTRQLALVSEQSLDAVNEFPTLELELEDTISGVEFFKQNDLAATRKQVAPLMRQFLNI